MRGVMIKCACGRQFKSAGKLKRHVRLSEGNPIHVPDRADTATERSLNRYNKSHGGG